MSSNRGASACKRRNRGLDLIGAGTLMPHRLLDEGDALGDHAPIPEFSILVLEQHDGAFGIEARRRARVLQQKKSRQPHDLGLARKELEKKPRQGGSLRRTRVRAHGRCPRSTNSPR